MLLIGFVIFVVLVLGVAAWNHIRYKHHRKRFEPFLDTERRFRDRLSEGYLTVIFWIVVLTSVYLAHASWNAATGPNPTSAMPFIAMLAAGIAVFSLAASSLNLIFSGKAYEQARVNGSAQIICYMTKADEEIAIRFENASSSVAAYDVQAVVGNENPASYCDKTKRFLGNDVTLLETPSFPPGRFYDFKISTMTGSDLQRGISIEVRIEWTSFHGQSFASSFVLKNPISFQKVS